MQPDITKRPIMFDNGKNIDEEKKEIKKQKILFDAAIDPIFEARNKY